MGKRFAALKAQVDQTRSYSLDEGIAIVKKTSNVKFDSSIEAHIRLGIDPSKSDQQIRATVSLPHGNGKTKTIGAFVGSNDEKASKEAGADFIYGEEEIKKLKDTGKIEFDIAVATPEMMPKLAVVAKILGPKGLMPNPKTDTVSSDVKKMIGELKKGKIAFKNDDGANVHASIGKASFSEAQLKENILAFVDTIKKLKPGSSKGTYLKSVYLTSSMGPSVKVEIPA
ncbi:MAG: 50S ribosomal protein L1 [Candidatus Magasanikbacteria bacterium RIFCSPHIGHO2_02_FULL_41_13]|uniref:Large ribosomal subunit protein uL1 n=1 Tax=Candidatus Magasanikbacteria bacterium RIFCSPHIGHO2_02_FULL_41_13 TaxID=1798676 RepID=A0A1F6M4N4_9BACT|nr:MAG: 50S ribosomal protein L1 [Candidatus Magasanikbacteria bacterium RIFCSPHIGHO2_02_FULL_41_13]